MGERISFKEIYKIMKYKKKKNGRIFYISLGYEKKERKFDEKMRKEV